MRDLPDVVRHFKANREDSLGFPLLSSLSEGVMSVISIETLRHDFGVAEEVWKKKEG